VPEPKQPIIIALVFFMGNGKQLCWRLVKHFVLSNFAKFVVSWSGCLKPLSTLVHSYHDLHVLCIHALLVVDRVSNSVLCQLIGISSHSWNMNIPLRHIIVSKLTSPCLSHVILSTKQGHCIIQVSFVWKWVCEGSHIEKKHNSCHCTFT
jgi:hypothetical protein